MNDPQHVLYELLDKLGIDDAAVSEEEVDGQITLSIETAHHALLIGRHGDNLRSLQHLYNVLLHRKLDQAQFVSLDVANYKKSKLEQLDRVAEEAIEKARSDQTEVRLKPMTAFERRQIHMRLADEADLVSESVGEEPHRTIVVRPRG